MTSDTPTQSSDRLDQIIAEYLAAEESGDPPSPEDVIAANPDLAEELRRFFANRDELAGALPGEPPRRQFVPPTVRYFGDYELLDEIARGGMGVVYRARQTSLNRVVAIKMILSGHLASEEDVKRFRSEAEAAGKLKHPGIVPVHEVGVHEGHHYFSMDYIEGRSLSEIVRENPLPSRKAAGYVQSIAEAVHYAHQQGTLHRDLKPSNVLVDTEDQVHVTDFGLAVRVDGDSELTRTGDVLGTPAYMPPEQAQAKRGLIGPGSDIYSMGAIVYDLLTGRPPFRGESSVETLRQVIEDEPVSPRLLNTTVPRDLETICLKCLQKEPRRRYSTAGALCDDLGRWLDNQPIRARPVGRVEKVWLWSRRKPAIAALSVVLLFVMILGSVAGLEQHRRLRVEGLVDQLLSAQTTRTPEIIDALAPYGRRAIRRLELANAAAQADSRAKLHSALAICALDGVARDTDYLQERLLTSTPAEFSVIRDALSDRRTELIERLWFVALDAESDSDRRFRASCVLATYAPDDTRWEAIAPFVADQLVSVMPFQLAAWRDQLRPVQSRLIEPLHEILRTPEQWPQKRTFAADSLADYLAGNVDALFALLMESGDQQFGVFVRALSTSHAEFVRRLEEELREPVDRSASEDGKERSARRRALVSLALYEIGRPESAESVLRSSPDPRARTSFIHWAAPFGIDANRLVAELSQEVDSSVRSALLLALGEFGRLHLPDAERDRLIPDLVAIYRDEPDPGLHGAARWVLQQWERVEQLEAVDRELRRTEQQWQDGRADDGRQWYVNGEGHTMVLVEADSFLMGAPDTAHPDFVGNMISPRDRPRHRIRVSRTFAVAATEVTRRQWERFVQDQNWNDPLHEANQYSFESQCPQNVVSWFQAAAYCTWLSRREGIPEDQLCYLPNTDGEYADGMRLASDFVNRTGYRLPTEAEWEFSCRAGTGTSRYYGESDDFLPHYAACRMNSELGTQPVTRFKPNDLGLFDTLGNVWEWCHDIGREYRVGTGEAVLDDQPSTEAVTDLRSRVLRGGGFFNSFHRLDGWDRTWYPPSRQSHEFGFRVARTVAAPSDYATESQWSRAQQFGRQSQWRAAAELMQESLEDERRPDCWLNTNHVWRYLGEIERIENNCDDMLRRFGDTEQPDVAHLVAMTSLQVADREVTEAIERLVEISVADGNLAHQRDAGLLHLRRGEYAQAALCLREAIGPEIWSYGRLYSLYYLAIAQHQLGDETAAQASLREAGRMRSAIEASLTEEDFGSRWFDWLGAEAVRREAEQVISFEDDESTIP